MNEQEIKRLSELRELVRETFAQTLMIGADTITDTADFFDELGGDSLDSLDVAVHLEELCGSRVPEEEYALCRCVEDAALLLLRLEQGGDAEKVPEEPHSVTPVTRFEDAPEYLAFQQRLRTAEETGMDCQIEVMAGHSGTNGWPLQVSREGVATAVLSLPLRYMHTPIETVSREDMENTAALLADFIRGLGEEAPSYD